MENVCSLKGFGAGIPELCNMDSCEEKPKFIVYGLKNDVPQEYFWTCKKHMNDFGNLVFDNCGCGTH